MTNVTKNTFIVLFLNSHLFKFYSAKVSEVRIEVFRPKRIWDCTRFSFHIISRTIYLAQCRVISIMQCSTVPRCQRSKSRLWENLRYAKFSISAKKDLGIHAIPLYTKPRIITRCKYPEVPRCQRSASRLWENLRYALPNAQCTACTLLSITLRSWVIFLHLSDSDCVIILHLSDSDLLYFLSFWFWFRDIPLSFCFCDIPLSFWFCDTPLSFC